MDADLLTIARKLAEGGHLPGVRFEPQFGALGVGDSPNVFVHATEADILFSVWTALNKPGLTFEKGLSNVFVDVHDPAGIKLPHTYSEPGTTTLSLLTAFAAALEEK